MVELPCRSVRIVIRMNFSPRRLRMEIRWRLLRAGLPQGSGGARGIATLMNQKCGSFVALTPLAGRTSALLKRVAPKRCGPCGAMMDEVCSTFQIAPTPVTRMAHKTSGLLHRARGHTVGLRISAA